MNSVFLPMSPVEATEAINNVMEEATGFELIAIPALGGCVAAPVAQAAGPFSRREITSRICSLWNGLVM